MPSKDAIISEFEDPPIKFIDIEDMLEQVYDRRREIDQEDAEESNYMSFNNIPPVKFAAIGKYRERNRIKLRFTYFPAIETLIVKIPTAKCEAAHRNFEGLFFFFL